MNNSAVQQSLIELEENLKKLESARVQVASVSKNSELLIVSVTKLVSNIELLQNEFTNQKDSFSDSVNTSLSDFNALLVKGTKTVLNKSDEISKKQEKAIDITIEKLNEFQSNIKELYSNEEKFFHESIHKSLGDFNEVLERGTETVINKSDEISKKQEKAIDVTIEKLNEFQSNIMELYSNEEKSFHESILKSLGDFNEILESETNQVLTKYGDLSKRQELAINVTISQLNTFQSTIKEVEKNIHDFDLEENFKLIQTEIHNLKQETISSNESLLNSIDLLHKDQQRKAMYTLIMLVVGFAIVIGLLAI